MAIAERLPVRAAEHSPSRHEELAHERKEPKAPKRRLLRLGAYALTISSLVHQSSALETMRYNREAAVQQTTDASRRYDDEITLTITGYNTSRTHTRESAETVAPVLGDIGATGWLGYADRSIDPDVMTAEVEEHLERHDYESPSFVGSSMGGLVSLEIAANLTDKGIIPRFVILDSTPADFHDNVKNSRMVLTANRLNKPVVKNAASSVQAVTEGKANIFEAGADFIHSSLFASNDPTKTTSMQTTEQLNYIRHFPIDDVASRISPETTIIYLGGGEKDTVVDTVAAHQRFDSKLPNHDVAYYDTGTGHANINGSPADKKKYQAILDEIAEQFTLPPVYGGGGAGGTYTRK